MTLKVNKDNGPGQTTTSVQLFDSVAVRAGASVVVSGYKFATSSLSASQQMHLMRCNLAWQSGRHLELFGNK